MALAILLAGCAAAPTVTEQQRIGANLAEYQTVLVSVEAADEIRQRNGYDVTAKELVQQFMDNLAARGKSATAQAHQETRNAWNVWWERWLYPQLDNNTAISGHSPSRLGRLSAASRTIARGIVNRGKNAVVRWFSGRLRVNLWRFRLRQKVGARIRNRLVADLKRFEAMMRTRKTKAGKLLNIPQLESAVHNWVGRHIVKYMSGRRAHKILRLVKKGKL